jgi:hypothetical protein
VTNLLAARSVSAKGWLPLAFVHALAQQCKNGGFAAHITNNADMELKRKVLAALFISALYNVVGRMEVNQIGVGPATAEVHAILVDLKKKASQQPPLGTDDAVASSAVFLSKVMKSNYQPDQPGSIVSLFDMNLDFLKSPAAKPQPEGTKLPNVMTGQSRENLMMSLGSSPEPASTGLPESTVYR